MIKRIFTEDLFDEKKQEEDVIELVYEKKKKIYVNIGLFTIYAALLIISLFII